MVELPSFCIWNSYEFSINKDENGWFFGRFRRKSIHLLWQKNDQICRNSVISQGNIFVSKNDRNGRNSVSISLSEPVNGSLNAEYDLSLILKDTDPVIEIIFSVKLSLSEYIIYIASCISLWFGFSIFQSLIDLVVNSIKEIGKRRPNHNRTMNQINGLNHHSTQLINNHQHINLLQSHTIHFWPYDLQQILPHYSEIWNQTKNSVQISGRG